MRGLSRYRWRVYVALGAAAVVGSVSVGVGLGANPGKEKIALTATGQAQAKAEVLRRADFVGSSWSGGPKKPNLTSTWDCSSYQPKQSDLVLIGAAESFWTGQGGLAIESDAQVLKTAAMVRRDWQRSVLAPQVLPCLRQSFAKMIGSGGKLISFRRVAFPRVATYMRAFRGVADAYTAAGRVRAEFEDVVLGSGQSEISFEITGPAAIKAGLRAAELRTARLLASRIRP